MNTFLLQTMVITIYMYSVMSVIDSLVAKQCPVAFCTFEASAKRIQIEFSWQIYTKTIRIFAQFLCAIIVGCHRDRKVIFTII